MMWDRVSKRRALVWGLWALVLLAGLAAIFILHSARSYAEAVAEFERSVGSPRHGDYLRAPVPDERNAVVAFARAGAQLELSPELSRSREPVAWSAEAEEAARGALEGNREAIDRLRSAAGLTSCVWPADPSLEPDSALRALPAARLLRLHGYVGVIDADETRTQEAFHILGTLAECLYSAPYILGSLVAAPVERMRLQIVRAAVASAATPPDLLEHFAGELEREAGIDRVRWAVAAEGAYALSLVEEQRADAGLRLGLRSPFFRHMQTTLASAWLEFSAWSELPLEELQSAPIAARRSRLSVGRIVADMAIPNLRHAVVKLRANRATVDLARLAVAGRLHGRRHGTYRGAFEPDAGIDVLSEGDGSAVLIDSRLEALLRADGSSSAGSGAPDSALELTVWRLPPPAASQG